MLQTLKDLLLRQKSYLPLKSHSYFLLQKSLHISFIPILAHATVDPRHHFDNDNFVGFIKGVWTDLSTKEPCSLLNVSLPN